MFSFLRREWLLNKRLLKNTSFLRVLLLIPLFTFAMMMIAEQEKGILTIAFCDEEQSSRSQNVLEHLQQTERVVRYEIYDDRESACAAVSSKKVDAAWILEPDFTERMYAFTSSTGNRKPPVMIVEREDTILLKLSKERLYSGLYSLLSESMIDNYFSERLETQGVDAEKSNEVFSKIQETIASGFTPLFVHHYLDSGKVPSATAEDDYLLMPIRGFLSVVIVVIGCAAGFIFLDDRERKLTTRFSDGHTLFFIYSYLLPAIIDGAMGMFLAISISGIFTSIFRELAALLLFVASCTAFCCFLCCLCFDTRMFSALLPILIVCMLLQCPVFFSLSKYQPLGIFFPSWYYLKSIHNESIFQAELLYTAVLIILTILLRWIQAKNLPAYQK
jgi:ABC-2 type transport system permease protein